MPPRSQLTTFVVLGSVCLTGLILLGRWALEAPEDPAPLSATASIAPGPPLTGVAPSPPELPPELSARRDVALQGWKEQAQTLMDSCASRPRQSRQPVSLEVSFAPGARSGGEARWRFKPERITIPPLELQRLGKDTPPDTVQSCLDRARSLPLEVPLPDGLRAADAPRFAASVLLQL